jgi:hypothetical protein
LGCVAAAWHRLFRPPPAEVERWIEEAIQAVFVKR